MSSSSPSIDDVAPSFGYLPDVDHLGQVLARGRFARALVLDLPVGTIADHVDESRVLWRHDISLPEGIYWFEGVDHGSVVVQVAVGASPGGSTITPVDELDDNHPLATAWDWAEHLWDLATQVPKPLFEINASAMTNPGGADVTVRERRFMRDQWKYVVVSGGRQQDILESGLQDLPQVEDPTTWVTGEPTPAGRFGATLTRAKLEGRFANTLFSFRATRTTFRPYQFKPVLKLLQTGKARLLIADEVGLGKTIEAGLIWTELEARQEADRVLIVCPSSLLTKWKEEMADRFDFELTELDGSELRKFLERHSNNRLPKRQAYICSLERLRSWPGLDDLKDVPPEFDLVIVDEAHAMRNQNTKSYALGTEIAEWAENLVFLTATPINLGQQDLLNLLELLAPEDYGDIQTLEMRLEPNRIINQVAARLIEKGIDGRELASALDGLARTVLGGAIMQRPGYPLLVELLLKGELSPRDIVTAKRYLADLNTLSTVITRTKKVEVDDRKAKRTERRKEVVWTDEENAFYEQYLEWCKDRAAAVGRPLYFAMQMPLRLASACLPMARSAVLDPEGFGDITDADSGQTSTRLEPHLELVEAALRLTDGVDTKFDQLRGVLETLHDQNRRALIFTHSRPALAYLTGRLAGDFRVAVMHGGVSREQRRRIMADFRAGEYEFVFANRVASEGLDFEFCSAVINYDLPWNPMEIEQRIGRIDRIGQLEETIYVINFANESTIDERILTKLFDRIKIFESSIGALEPIISANAPLVLQVGFDFTLNPQEREQKLHEVLQALEEQQAGLKDVSDASSALMVSNDVDVAGLEDDLVRTGRYIGQRELALLLDDWAHTDGAEGIRSTRDAQVVEFHGNPAMAARVDKLAKSEQRTRAETRTISARLRDEMPLHLVLDQERARTSGGTLLTATSPLVMAATDVPRHRQARFASLRLTASPENVTPGTYIVVVARAMSASVGGDEIWGSSVDISGRDAGDGPFNALLAALAEGQLMDAPVPKIERLPRLAGRALFNLDIRHEEEQAKRTKEFYALQEAKAVSLREQHSRKLQAIDRRIETATSRGRGDRSIALFQSQHRRARERYARLSAEVRAANQPTIDLEKLAACVVEVSDEGKS